MAQRFHIVTYNVQYNTAVSPPDDAARVVQEQFDLAGFQEVFDPLGFSYVLFGIPFLIYRLVQGHYGMHRALESALRRQGFFTDWESYGRPILPLAILVLGAQRIGLLSAVKDFPPPNAPVRFEVHSTDWRKLGDYPARQSVLGREIRIVQYVSVTLKPPADNQALGDLPIDFFNVHLTDSNVAGRRATEIRNLLDFIDEKRLVSSTDTQIVVGDFNAEPDDPEIQDQMINQGGFVDAWVQGGGGPGPTHNSHATGGATRRIDYIFVNLSALGPAPNLHIVGAQRLYDAAPLISDHLGVCAILERG